MQKAILGGEINTNAFSLKELREIERKKLSSEKEKKTEPKCMCEGDYIYCEGRRAG